MCKKLHYIHSNRRGRTLSIANFNKIADSFRRCQQFFVNLFFGDFENCFFKTGFYNLWVLLINHIATIFIVRSYIKFFVFESIIKKV